MKLALFKRIDGNWDIVWEQTGDGSDPVPGEYVRISEYVDVTFTPLKRPEVIAAQVRGLDLQIESVTQEFAQKLDALKSRKQELLAITDERAA